MGHRRHSLLKISFVKPEKISVKRIFNPYRKGYVNLFEIDESDSTLAALEFLSTDSHDDDNK